MMTTYLQPIILTEASKTEQKLLGQLDAIPLGRMYQASFKAVVRLHLWFTGRTNELFAQFVKEARAAIVDQAGKNQVLDGSSGFQAQTEILKLWGDTFKTWSDEFYKVRVEAGSIPFGVLAVAHERLIVERLKSNVEERVTLDVQRLTETVQDGVFSPQLSVLLNQASQWFYGDNLNLSARVWNVDREARDGINAVILKGVTNGDSAWNIAKELEQFLGANADCPRWTSVRLYGRTKTEIAAGDTAGLQGDSGTPCDGKGVSYNALRLARTEIQKAHALATDKVMAMQPWVKAEKINLSAAHAERDICDDVAGGGENGDGVYPVGTIELPLHPNCLDYKTAVLMPEKEFTSQLNGWLKGEQDWSEMDAYASLVTGQTSNVGSDAFSQSLLPNAINLAVWLFSDKLKV